MKTWIVFIVVPIVILAIALTGGFVLVWRLFYLSVVLLLLGFTWAWLSTRGIDGEVSGLPEYSQVGKHFDCETTVVNRSGIPKQTIEVWENTNLPGYRNMMAFSLPAHSSRQWYSRVTCQQRGRYGAGSLTATVTDPLGIFSLQRNAGENRSVLVYPATVDLPFFTLTPEGNSGHNTNRWFGREITSSAARIRDYQNGDSYKHIHWPSTARTGRVMVRTFDPERPTSAPKPLWVVVDMHTGYHAGRDSESTEEYGITVAASLVKKYTEKGVRVGVMASGDRPCLFFPEANEEHRWRVMGVLAVIRATGGLPVEQLISGEMKRFTEDSTLVVITPSPSPQLAAALRHVMSRGITVVAIFIDPLSFGGNVSTVPNARRLAASGLQVYLVRRGEDMARSLDFRFAAKDLRNSGDSA